MPRRYVVGKLKPLAPPVLPKDRIVGRTFIEANGDRLEAVWTGTGPLPGSEDWPDGIPPHDRTIGNKW